MAFPAPVSAATTSIATAATPHTVNIGTPSSGEMLVLVGRANVGGAAFTLPAGWTTLIDADHAATSTDREIIAYKTLAGGDAEVSSATMSVTPPGSSKASYIVQRITGAGTPEISTRASGASTTPNAPSFTPSGGALDYLWLAVGGWEGEQTSPPTTPPTNYTHAGAASGTTGNVDTNTRAWLARRQLNAASEDPGAVTISVSDEWSVYTMAIPPPIDVTVTPGSATALGVSPAPAVLATVAPTASVGLGSSPAPVVAVVQAPTAALALGVTPAATPIISGGGTTVTPPAAIALGVTPQPSVAVARPVTAQVGLGATPQPVIAIAKANTSAIALGLTPSAVALVSRVVTAAMSLGATPSPAVLVVVPIGPATALGSTPAPTVISGAGSTVMVTAATALGSTPAPAVLVVRPVTAATAAGSTPSPVILIVRAVSAALAIGSAPSPLVLSGLLMVVAEVVITEASNGAVTASSVTTDAVTVGESGDVVLTVVNT